MAEGDGTRAGGTETPVPARTQGVRQEPSIPTAGPDGASPVLRAEARQSWREQILTRVDEIDALRAWFSELPDVAANADDADGRSRPANGLARLDATVAAHARAAREAASGPVAPGPMQKLWSPLHALKVGITGAEVERAASQRDAAEVALLRLAPPSYVAGQLPALRAHVESHLPPSDLRRRQLERLATARSGAQELRRADREAVVAAVRAASTAARLELIRVRSFRNLVAATTGVLAALAVIAVWLMAADPDAVELCFRPEGKPRVCAVGTESDSTDVHVIWLVGLVGAAISSALTLRRIKGTSTPYSIPISLALLKLPLGVLTAYAGLLFMTAGFVPGLSALDSSQQIVAWAFVFGFAQQVVTRVADQQGQRVLEGVGTPKEPDQAATARS